MRTNKIRSVALAILLTAILALCFCITILPQNNFASAENTNNTGAYVGFSNGADVCQTLIDNASITNEPVITVLTPGQGSDVSSWSNNNVVNTLTYDSQSLFERLRLSNDTKVYIATIDGNNVRQLIEIQETNEDGQYSNYDKYNDISYVKLMDTNFHSIILFESYSNSDYQSHDAVYADFERFLDDISYDYYYQTGQVPKINLIGHSRGGIINMKYASEHPNMIESIFSIGTPYIGTNMGILLKELVEKGFSVGELAGELGLDSFNNIIEPTIQNALKTDWEAAYVINPTIDAHAIGGKIDADVLDEISTSANLPGIVDTLLNYIADVSAYCPLFASASIQIATAIAAEFMDKYPVSLDDVLEDLKVDFGYFYDHIWDTYLKEVSLVFENDIMVDLYSQLATGYSGFKRYERLYDAVGYDSLKSARPVSPKVPHNVEPRDPDIISYILDNIDIGQSSSPFRYHEKEYSITITGLKRQGNNMTELTIPETINNKPVTEIADYAFANGYNNRAISAKTKITIPKSVTSIGKLAFVGTNIAEFAIASENTNYCAIDGNLFVKNGSEIIQYAIGNTRTSYQMPSSVTTIERFAFFNADYLTSIDLNNVSLIKEFGFAESNIATVSNGANALTVGKFAFNNVPYLNDSTQNFLVLKGNLLKCNASGVVEASDFPVDIVRICSNAFEGSAITSVALPLSIKFIDASAFFGAESLETVELHEALEYLGYAAFQNCASLTGVYAEFTNPVIANEDVFNNCGDTFKIYVKQLYKNDFAQSGGFARYSDKLTTETSTIAFNANGGSVTTDTVSVPYFSNLPELPTPVKNGYTFMGWYDALNDGTKFITGSLWNKKGNQTLYAHWSLDVYTLTYELDGGINNVDNPTSYTFESAVTLLSPAKTGYTFVGWYDNSSFAGNPISSINAGTTGNKTLYAKWNANQYTVTLNKNAADASMSGSTSVSLTYGASFSLAIPTRQGYYFEGWCETADGTGAMVTNSGGDGVTVWNRNADTTLYAKWHVKSFELKINADGTFTWIGGSGLSNTATQVTYGSAINLVNLIYDYKCSPNGYREGHSFSHFKIGNETINWTTVPDLGQNGSVVLITPVWDVETHTIYYKSLVSGIEYIGTAAQYGANITLPNPSRAGYTFEGWYTFSKINENLEALIGNITYHSKFEFVKMPDLTVPADVTSASDRYSAQNNGSIELAAKWTANTYTVSFNTNGAGSLAPITVTFDSSYTLPNDPVRNGYTFNGWKYNNNNFVVGEKWNIASNITLSASWTATEYNITYNLNNGDTIENRPENYTVESPTIVIPNCERYGYTFLHWIKNGNPSDIVTAISAGSTGDITLTPIFSGSTLTISNDGSYNVKEGNYTLVDITYSGNGNVYLNISNTSKISILGHVTEVKVSITISGNQNTLMEIKNVNIDAPDNSSAIVSTVDTLTIQSVIDAGNITNNIKGGTKTEEGDNATIVCKNLIIQGEKINIAGAKASGTEYGDGIYGGDAIYSEHIDQTTITLNAKDLEIRGGDASDATDGYGGGGGYGILVYGNVNAMQACKVFGGNGGKAEKGYEGAGGEAVDCLTILNSHLIEIKKGDEGETNA